MTDTAAFQDLEKVYDLVAHAIDEAGPQNEALFLSKLCMVLAHNISDVAITEEAIRIAQLDLQP
jgi:hypothetical protein